MSRNKRKAGGSTGCAAPYSVKKGRQALITIVLRYTVPMLALATVTAGFLRARRHRPLGRAARAVLAGVAALPLLASGTVHLLRPSAMVPLLPPWVPERTLVIMATALPELAGALGLFFASTRRPAATWLAVFMIAIFPANVYVAGRSVQGLVMPSVPVRTAMQAAYILLLLVAGHGWPDFRQRVRGQVAQG